MPPPRKTRGRGTGGARGAAISETSVVAASAPWPADVRYVTSLVFGDDVRHGARGLYEKYRPSGDAPIEAPLAVGYDLHLEVLGRFVEPESAGKPKPWGAIVVRGRAEEPDLVPG